MVFVTLKVLLISSAPLMVLMPTAASPGPTGPNVSMNTVTITPDVAPLLQKASPEAWANQCLQAFQVVGAFPVEFVPAKEEYGPLVPPIYRDMAMAAQYQMPDINVSR